MTTMFAIFAALVLAVIATLGATFSKLLADEYKAWAPSIAKALIAKAVSLTPNELRERAAEEWQRHIDDSPGDLSKTYEALTLLVGAWLSLRKDRKGKTARWLRQAVLPIMDSVGTFFLASMARVLLPCTPIMISFLKNGQASLEIVSVTTIVVSTFYIWSSYFNVSRALYTVCTVAALIAFMVPNGSVSEFYVIWLLGATLLLQLSELFWRHVVFDQPFPAE
jgi:hypothetical protein